MYQGTSVFSASLRVPLPLLKFSYRAMSALAFIFISLCAIITITFASPLPFNATAVATAQLAKRTDHTGKVSSFCFLSLTDGSLYDLQATYFDVGLGACGHVDSNNDHIVAV